MKTASSPTQGQPNPRKIRLKVAFGPLFPTTITFRGLGLVLYRKQTIRNLTQPNSPRAPYWKNKRRWVQQCCTSSGKKPGQPDARYIIAKKCCCAMLDSNTSGAERDTSMVLQRNQQQYLYNTKLGLIPLLLLLSRVNYTVAFFFFCIYYCLLYTSPSPRD